MTTLAEALAPKSDQLNADDLIAGPRVLKITGARIVRDGRDTKVVLNYDGDNGKPWKPCKTMGRAMVMAWAIADEQQMVGKSVRVFRDPTVRFGADGEVGGIRISHMSHIDKAANIKLTEAQGKKRLYTFQPLPTAVPRDASDELTFEGAELSLRTAKTLDELEQAWRKKAMASHREALKPVLAERKAEMTPSNTDATDTVAMFDAAATPEAIEAADKAANVLNIAADPAIVDARERAWDRGTAA
jgi:hypothetical protein